MQYMCLIYATESSAPSPGSTEFKAMLDAYGAFTQKVQDDGKMVAGNALQPVATATTVSVREGATETIDGPFAETKEQLGGYYILDCKDLDEAMTYAAMIPSAKRGRIEVRPVMVFD